MKRGCRQGYIISVASHAGPLGCFWQFRLSRTCHTKTARWSTQHIVRRSVRHLLGPEACVATTSAISSMGAKRPSVPPPPGALHCGRIARTRGTQLRQIFSLEAGHTWCVSLAPPSPLGRHQYCICHNVVKPVTNAWACPFRVRVCRECRWRLGLAHRANMRVASKVVSTKLRPWQSVAPTTVVPSTHRRV